MAIAKPIRGQQQGMALVMGLIILLVMTLISISAMRSTIMQERMTGAFEGQQMAFQAAEAALRQAERNLAETSVPIGDKGYFNEKNPNREPPDWADPGASPQPGETLVYDRQTLDGVARQPQFYAEKLEVSCEAPDLEAGKDIAANSFRVMARGFGANDNTQVVLETFYCR